MGFDGCWERVRKGTGLKTQTALAETLGIRSASVTDAKNRNSFPADWGVRIAQRFGLSTDWILTGKPPMRLMPPVQNEEVQELDGTYDDLSAELENYIADLEEYEFNALSEGVHDSLFMKFKYLIKHCKESERYVLRGFLDEMFERVKKREQKRVESNPKFKP